MEQQSRTIVAMGGGGFSMEPENPLLDRYVLSLTNMENPAVCFVPTASGDSEGYTERFYTAFNQLPCRTTHLSLFKPPAGDLRAFVLAQDVIYVGGGNTRNLIVLWREWGLDAILREAWEGKILAGISAGMICWFESGLTDSTPGGTGDPIDNLSPLRCLGWLSGSATHYDGEANRRPAYQRMVASGRLAPGYAADDGAALHFSGTELHQVISSRPSARAYRVERVNDTAVETALTPDFLGTAEPA